MINFHNVLQHLKSRTLIFTLNLFIIKNILDSSRVNKVRAINKFEKRQGIYALPVTTGQKVG